MMELVDNGFLLHLLVAEIVDRQEREILRRTHRQIRDHSNPFEMPEQPFRKIFRLSRQLAFDVYNQLNNFLPQPTRATFIPNHLKMLLTLNFYAYGSYQGVVGEDFNFPCSQPTVSRVVRVISDAIVNHLLQEKIIFPVTPANVAVTQLNFLNKFGFPHVLGCIDGTHVAIVSPPVEHELYPGAAYYNRKGYTSINVQIICDANLKITSINARYPGATHDAAIWQMSNIQQHLRNKYFLGELNGWLLGDSGYPLQPWLLTPIVDAPENSPEQRYTNCHCRTRNTIERLNGVLKSRFRCLCKHRVLHYLPPTAGKIIYSCAVLHNMCIERNINLEEDLVNEEDIEIIENERIDRNILLQGQRIRNGVIENYFN